MAGKKVCFVIAPIGDEESATRKRSDKVLRHIIEPPAKEFGYEVLRADKISQPGLITAQVIQQLANAALVIADLTQHNPNVFYELAVRHAADKPVVHIIEEGDQIPFDVSDFRTIKFSHTDLDSAEAAKKQIAAQIREIEAGKVAVQTPIKFSLALDQLAGAEGQQQILKQMLEGLQEIRGAMSQLQSTVAGLEAAQRRLDQERTVASLFGEHPRGFFGLAAPTRPLAELLKPLEPTPVKKNKKSEG